MKTIKINEEIWTALQKEAVPFQDTPNDVLSRWWQELMTRRNGSMPISPPSPVVTESGDRAESFHMNQIHGNHLKGKVLGARIRNQYVEQLNEEGILLTEETGLQKRSSLLTANGNRVIILVANRELEVGQWFLGVQEAFVSEKTGTFLILLCKDGDRFFDFVIPPSQVRTLIQEVRDVPSMPGAKKFSIFRNGGGFKLRKRGGGTIDLDGYLSKYDELRRAAA